MEIRLKQKDIEEAVSMYLASQGVARAVSNISFTMGRKDAGLSAEVECAEGTPGFEASIPQNVATPSEVLKRGEAQAMAQYTAEKENEDETTEDEEPVAEEAVVAQETKKSDSSLFSS